MDASVALKSVTIPLVAYRFLGTVSVSAYAVLASNLLTVIEPTPQLRSPTLSCPLNVLIPDHVECHEDSFLMCAEGLKDT